MAFMQENTWVFWKERNMRVGRDESRKGRNYKEQQKSQGNWGGCEVIVPGRGKVIGIEDCGKRNYLHCEIFCYLSALESKIHVRNTFKVGRLYLYRCKDRVWTRIYVVRELLTVVLSFVALTTKELVSSS